MSLTLVRPLPAVFWELRGYWAAGRRVALTLDADVPRAEGYVTRVTATDTAVYIGDLLVPADRILAVHSPSRVGDSDFDDAPGRRWAGRPRRIQQVPEQGELELGEERGC